MKSIVDVLKALSDETRLRIINLLYEKELCVCDIMEILQISQTKASRHLAYLKKVGMISDRKHAQWVYYAILKNTDIRFLEILVFDIFRNMELYKKDLENMESWLKRKTISCI